MVGTEGWLEQRYVWIRKMTESEGWLGQKDAGIEGWLNQRDGWAKKMDGSKELPDHRNAWTRGMAGQTDTAPEGCMSQRDQRGGWNRGMAESERWLDQRDGCAVRLSARGYSGIETKQKLCQAPSVLTAWRLTLA
jgi:hypothetical protein